MSQEAAGADLKKLEQALDAPAEAAGKVSPTLHAFSLAGFPLS